MTTRNPWLVALAVLTIVFAVVRGLTLAAALGGGIAAPTLWLTVLLQVFGALLAAFAWFIRPVLAPVGLVLVCVGVVSEVLLEAFLHGTRAPLPALAVTAVAVALLAILLWLSRTQVRGEG